MEEKVGADDVGSEEDDVDAQGKFFVAINVRSRHRKLHICGRCGTKPGQNFAAYEPHNNLKGVKLKFPLWPLLEGQRPKGSRGKLDDDEFERHGLSSKKKGERELHLGDRSHDVHVHATGEGRGQNGPAK